MKTSITKTGLAAAIMVALSGASQAATISAVNDGSWSTGATWSNGTGPSTTDIASISSSYAVTLDAPATISQLVIDGTNPSLTLNSGAVLQSTTTATVIAQANKKGSLTINNGASFSSTAVTVLSHGINSVGTMTVDGGTFSGNAFRMGNSAAVTNINASLQVTNGGHFTLASSFTFQAASSVMAVTMTGSSSAFTATNLDFNTGGSFTMNSGTLTLTTNTESAALDAETLLYFNAGKIVFKGVDSEADFLTFTSIWNAWVDNGNITSTLGYTTSQLKGALSYDSLNADAIAVIPEPMTLSLLLVGSAAIGVSRRFSVKATATKTP